MATPETRFVDTSADWFVVEGLDPDTTEPSNDGEKVRARAKVNSPVNRLKAPDNRLAIMADLGTEPDDQALK